MRLFKYLGKHLGAVVLVFVLLIGQAFCDLMLPNYTAQIVDVGIQQAGVDHASTTELSAATHDAIAAQLSGEGAELFAASYDPTGNGTYALNAYGESHRAELDEAVALPLVTQFMGAGSEIDENLVGQQAIAAARAEYAALGYDMNAMQMNALMFTALKMMGFVLLSVCIAALVGLVAARTGAKIGRELRGKLFAKVMSFSDAEVQRFSAASLITRGTNDVQQIQMMSIMLMRMVLYAPILAIGGIIMIAQMDVSMGWIIGAAIAAIVVVVLVLMAIAMPKFKIMQKLVDRVNLVSRERLTGVQVVRAFGSQKREQERFDVASTELMRTQLFTNRVMVFLMPVMMVIMNLVSVVIVWAGAGQIDAGNIQTGDLIAFITYSMVIIMGFLMLSMLAIIAPRADVSAGRIDEVLEAEVSIVDPVEPATPGKLSEGSGVTIEFDNVSFRYDDSSECVLQDVSFTAEAGKTCAIIGSTGSGKSTIIKLVERFYDVTDGAVRVNGVDVRDMPLHDLRTQFGYVPQRAFLFTGTIESNVGYGEDDPDEARILEAIDIAQAAEFVESKEDGLESEITQGGTNVSGGQRQRLAIARALATDARGLLFDDSFSALDYKTDAQLRRALAERLPGKTQLIVAQRIATVMQADKIVVLDEGRVVGQGTHAELLRTCDQYREIAYSQLSPEELEGSAQPASLSEGGDLR
ncbi:MAG: ABC transporter ATP-binding protein [Coriobacteriaceae bacterium]|jgi:ATP-binding cassette subfamily B protein|nr:ABC transporter ATP-binding protein [Coriobacteriaceae bacterium]